MPTESAVATGMASAVLTAAPASSLSKSFVVGSCAHFLGKRAEENKSHEWSVYVRSTSPDEDPSVFIKRVVFQLHPTLQPPTRGAPFATEHIRCPNTPHRNHYQPATPGRSYRLPFTPPPGPNIRAYLVS